MSDDRMDRAERIRNMREGNRGTDDDHADTESDSADTEGTKGDETATTTVTDETPSTTGATDDLTDRERTSDRPDSPTARAEATDATQTTDSREASAATAADTQTVVGTGPATDVDDDDATAAAQRAAASAAEVMSGGADAAGVTDTDGPSESSSATDTGGAPSGIAQAPAGIELPDQELLEAAMSNATETSTEGGARAAAIGSQSTQSEELVRVLEFSLGDEYYCLDIEYVEEIVKRSSVTRVPNTPEFVDGVVDLRGQITTILEPKEMMDIDTDGEQNLIIVFDPEQFEDQGAVGWVVDEVRQVVPVTESELNSPPVDADYINGIVDREEYEQFVIWVEPDDALEQATTTAEE